MESADKKIKVAIDMTWMRHKIVGGTEVYARNLVDGFISVNETGIEYYLLLAEDNIGLFKDYKYKNIHLVKCRTKSMKRIGRVLWQNLSLGNTLRRRGIRICIEPVYARPFIRLKDIRFITVIHDLQAVHYPQYFNKWRVMYMKAAWRLAIKYSEKIVVTSKFVKNDILSRYKISEKDIDIISDPVTINPEETADVGILQNYGATADNYYYMCCSTLPHENIETIIKALGILKKNGSDQYAPLFLSGNGGRADRETDLIKLAIRCHIKDDLHILPFIPTEDRNRFYRSCKTFLAPSLFEGFGMPPIEAMIMGAPVLTTMETCSYETTKGIATYVKNARDEEEWALRLDEGVKKPEYHEVQKLAEEYSKGHVARSFNKLIKEVDYGGQ